LAADQIAERKESVFGSCRRRKTNRIQSGGTNGLEKLKRREIKFGPEFQGVDKKDRVFTCEKHFGAEDVEIFVTEKQTKNKPRFGALPMLNMPEKATKQRDHHQDLTDRW